jgi:hypothetical protein
MNCFLGSYNFCVRYKNYLNLVRIEPYNSIGNTVNKCFPVIKIGLILITNKLGDEWIS